MNGPDDRPDEHARDAPPVDAHARDEALRRTLDTQVRRLRDHRPAGLLGLLVTGGTAGLLLVVPLVIGAYLGRWLDERAAGYSVRWTVNLILLGLGVGIANVILFFREHDR